jgi:uncharacterized membrane protein YedE/YeeE
MKNVKFLFIGLLFGLALTKGEAIAWVRIQEMFRFEGFQLFGIFFTAIPTGAICVLLIKKFKIKTLQGESIEFPPKKYSHGLIIGGLIFGCGWTLTGACPGPLYSQIGSGSLVTIITLLSALAGTWTFGYFQSKLPD